MAKAICCDRCGKFEKINDACKWKSIGGGSQSASDPCGISEQQVLCPDCADDFKDFMKNSKSSSKHN